MLDATVARLPGREALADSVGSQRGGLLAFILTGGTQEFVFDLTDGWVQVT